MTPPRRDDDDEITAAKRCLTESSRDVWNRWSLDREQRALQKKVKAEQDAREAAGQPIFPRECAQRIAQDTADAAPDWRYIKPTLGPAWGRLLKSQPELAPAVTRQRLAIIRAVFDAAPPHLRAAVQELQVLLDQAITAHECAGYLVGFEAGKIHRDTIHDRDGRHDRRRMKPSRSSPSTPSPDAELRLTLADEGGE